MDEIEQGTGARELADDLLAAVEAGDGDAMLSCMTRALGLPRHTALPGRTKPEVRIHKYRCPWCDPDGPFNTGGTAGRVGGVKCIDCTGTGVLSAEQVPNPGVFEPGELVELGRPPAVMRQPCVDCAYRPGSPEDDTHPDMLSVAARPGVDTPFFCHHGMVRVGDGYEAVAYYGTLPLGAMVCAGWWALATGNPLPDKEFRDPGGADRPADAPEVP